MERNNICKSCNFEYWNCIRYIVESCRSLIGRVRAMTFHVTNIGASKMEKQINLSLFFRRYFGVFRFSQLIYASFHPFFLNRLPAILRFGVVLSVEYFESNISQHLDATPGALPPLSLLDFHRMHLGGLSVILSCRQLQTRRPITVSIEGVWTKARRQFLAAKLRVNVPILFSFLFNSRSRWPCRGLIGNRAINQAASIFPRKLFGLYPFVNVKETSTYVCIFSWCRRDIGHAQWSFWLVCTWLNRVRTDAASNAHLAVRFPFRFCPVKLFQVIFYRPILLVSRLGEKGKELRAGGYKYYWVGN